MSEELNKTNWYHGLQELSLAESRDALTDTLHTLTEINISESKISPAVCKRRFYVKQNLFILLKPNMQIFKMYKILIVYYE